ncbi:MAG: glycosyltransferase family 2 protein, partial [Proteobacteria bacterium]|nr:glycosyltransferase family 2 protein [Pseudomonadota bacterium]MBU1594117.1 glycosyltransferase family 2 protein [Pseudomonadota bacterium]
MDFAWDRLPEPVLEGLCVGGSGKLHLLRLARLCLDAGPDAGAGAVLSRPLGLDLLQAAFEADPLDAGLAGQLLALSPDVSAGPLGPALAALVRQARPNAEAEGCERLAARGD